MRFCRQCGGGGGVGGGGGGLFGRLRLYILLFGNLSVCLFAFFSAHLLLTEISFALNNIHSFKEHVDFSLN